MKAFKLRNALPCIALIALLAPTIANAQKSYLWVEGETPSSVNLKPAISGWGHQEFLSGRKWLQVSIEADKVKVHPVCDVLLVASQRHSSRSKPGERS